MHEGGVQESRQGLGEERQADYPCFSEQAKGEVVEVFTVADLIQLGPGLAIAFIVLLWKRADDQKYQQCLRDQQADMAKLTDRFIAAIEANTVAFQTVADAVNISKMIGELRDDLQEGTALRQAR